MYITDLTKAQPFAKGLLGAGAIRRYYIDSINAENVKLGFYIKYGEGRYSDDWLCYLITDKPCIVTGHNEEQYSEGGQIYYGNITENCNRNIGGYYYSAHYFPLGFSRPQYVDYIAPFVKIGTADIDYSIVNEIMGEPYLDPVKCDLDIYTQGKTNPLISLVWSNIQNAVEGRQYYVDILGLSESGGVYNLRLADNIPFEDSSATVSYNDAVDMGTLYGTSDNNYIYLGFHLWHYGDRSVDKVVDYEVLGIGILENGEIYPDENYDRHEDESVTDDDNYNDDTNNFISMTSGNGESLANILTTSYIISKTDLRALKNFMWSADFHDNLLLINNNPIENIVSLKAFPFEVSSDSAVPVKVGNVSIEGVNGRPVKDTTNVMQIGSQPIKITEKYHNFLDYLHTGVSIYLPFIGVHDLPTTLVMNNYLKVLFYYDVLTGSCVYELQVGKNNTFTTFDFVQGSCASDLPITAQNRTQVEIAQEKARLSGVASLVGGAVGTVGGLATGNIGTATASLVGGAMGALNSKIAYDTAQYHTTSKGSIGSQLINIVPRNCMIIYDRPKVTIPSIYGHDFGKPCELALNLGNCNGFTQVSHTVELSGIPCTEQERAELRQYLTSGVYLDWNATIPNDVIEHNFQMVLYKNSSDNAVVSKSLANVGRLDNVKWKEDTNIFKPSVTFRKFDKWKKANYVKMNVNGSDKFYYITNEILRTGGILELELHCDVLMTYRSYIQGIKTIVTRQERVFNNYLNDNNIAIPTERIIECVDVGTISDTNKSIVLTVTN